MTQAAIHGASGSPLPKIHHVGETTSTLDTAFELAKKGRMTEWDSVLASSQTEGRGQMRKAWQSPPGNLYAAICMPKKPPFDSTASAVALGAFIANALSSFGCRVHLKWPNDLVLAKGDKHAKLGGILLEERDGMLMAGVGINMYSAPENLEPDALPAGSLLDACPDDLPGSVELWQALVKHVHSVYKSGAFFSLIWKNLAEDMLLWRGQHVSLHDGDEVMEGVFVGLGDDGAAIIDCRGRHDHRLSGSMRRAPGHA